MKSELTERAPFRHGVVALALIVFSAEAAAASLGRMQALALLGRGLDVRIPVTLAAAESAENLCPKVEVFYGDTRAASTVEVVRAPRGGDWQLRIRSNVAVDEPVVSLSVVLGCESVQTRRYTLLAEPPPDDAAPLVSAGAVPLGSSTSGEPIVRSATPVVLAKPAMPVVDLERFGSQAAAAPTQTTEARPAKKKRRQPKAAASSSPATADLAQPESSSASNATGGNPTLNEQKRAKRKQVETSLRKDRLRMEPIDLRSPIEAGGLKSSSLMESVPSANPQQRAAFSALWQALSSPPEEAAKNSLRLDQLQADVKALREQSKAQASAMESAQGKIASNDNTRLAIYGLGGLLGLIMLGAAVFTGLRWRAGRFSGNAPWWRPKGEDAEESGFASAKALEASKVDSLNKTAPKSSWQQPDADAEAELGRALPRGNVRGNAAQPFSARAPIVKAGIQADGSELTQTQVDNQRWAALAGAKSVEQSRKLVDEILAAEGPDSESAPMSRSSDNQSGPPLGASADFSMSLPATSKYVTAEDLIDISQQADFFVSLGQHDQAIELLNEHIEGDTETSPLPYFDLLGLYHGQGKQAEFAELRQRFHGRFNADVPFFEAFTDDRGGLENYPLALSRISALWPSVKVLKVIEESLLRKPDSRTKPFNLQAYRELLFLYTFVKAQSESTEPMRAQGNGDFEPTRIRPLNQSLGTTSAFDISIRNPDSGYTPGASDSTGVNAGVAGAASSKRPGRGEAIDPNFVAPSGWPTDMPPPSMNVGVDIDLSDEAFEPALQSEPMRLSDDSVDELLDGGLVALDLLNVTPAPAAHGPWASAPVVQGSAMFDSQDSGMIEFDLATSSQLGKMNQKSPRGGKP